MERNFIYPIFFLLIKKSNSNFFLTKYVTGIINVHAKLGDIFNRMNIRQNSKIGSTWGYPSVDASFPGL
jgi:hypothetical protein